MEMKRRYSRQKKIGSLPDDLLVSILSSLPVSDVVRTSKISRRWRHLWTRTSRLDLRCDGDRHMLAGAVEKVLQANTACTIDTCKILLHEKDSRIDGLCTKSITKLWIGACKSKDVAVPEQVRSLDSLQELVVHDLELKEGLDFSCLNNLRSLSLGGVKLSNITVAAIVNALPSLERLCIWKMRSVSKVIKISSICLKQLEIGAMSLELLEIYAPALTCLTMDVASCEFAIHAPMLAALKTNFILGHEGISSGSSKEEDELESHCQRSVQLLELSSGIYEGDGISKLKFDYALFTKLQKLSIHINLNDIRQMVVLAFVMTECIDLRELDLTVGKDVIVDSEHSCLPYTETEYWRRQVFCQHGCVSRRLEHISIKDFTGETLELEFVRFLILKATVLKKLVILHKCSGKWLEALAYLMSLKLPRASPDLDIAVYPGVKEWTGRSLLAGFYMDWLSHVDDKERVEGQQEESQSV